MIDLLIVLAFVFYSVFTGFFYQKKAREGLEEYFLAGRTLKGWQAGLSMAATQYAADTPLLVTGLVATAGIFSLWRLWIYALAFLLMGFVLGAAWRNARVLTDAELTEVRYHGTWAALLRALKAIHLGTVVNCTILAMVLLAATRIAEPFLIWHEWLPAWLMNPIVEGVQRFDLVLTSLLKDHPSVWVYSANNFISILAIVSFTALYSATGGLRSVVATDVVQFSLAMIATAVYAWIVIDRIGGFGALGTRLSDLYGPETARSVLSFGPSDFEPLTMLFFCVLAVQWFAQVNADGTGYLAQRTMACSTDRQAKLAAIIFTTGQILFRGLLWIPIALGLLILYPAESLPIGGEVSGAFTLMREETFARGINDFLPVGAKGLMLTGMLAALASTVDTHLNWGASYWSNDLYKRFLMEQFMKRSPKRTELVWVARVSNLLILVIALAIMVRLESIQKAWHLSLLFGGGLGTVLILRWIWSRINIWSEISAGVLSLALAFVLIHFFPGLNEGLKLMVLVFVSTLGMLLVTKLTPPEPEETLQAFYRRVRPPGFWRKAALAAGDDGGAPLKRFYFGITATVTFALSIFFWLTGFGIWMTSGFSLLPVLLLVAGFLLGPLWLRYGFAPKTLY
ncbi:MAG: Na+:solute symporter [Candidatus Omnitrophica bacterium]|nr:Na+:solute symporter [Candidatus Omnitrophota bacterium]